MKKYLFALGAVSALILAACDDSSSNPFQSGGDDPSVEKGSSGSRGDDSSDSKGSSGSKAGSSDSKGGNIGSLDIKSIDDVPKDKNGTYYFDGNEVSVEVGSITSLGPESNICIATFEGSTGVCVAEDERTYTWKPVKSKTQQMDLVLVDGKLQVNSEGVTLIFTGNSDGKIEGTWNLEGAEMSGEYFPLEDMMGVLSSTYEITQEKYIMTTVYEGELATNPLVLGRSYFLQYIYNMLTGSEYPLYVEDLYESYFLNLFPAGDALREDVTVLEDSDSSQTFVLNGTTYTVTVDSVARKTTGGREVFVTVATEEKTCEWHETDWEVTQDLCKNENWDHLDFDKNASSEYGQVVSTYWEGNKKDFIKCIKSIATLPKDSIEE